MLLANTTYWVTVDREAGSFVVSRTNSDSQSGLSGWSIGDTSRNRGAGWNTSTTRSSHLILSVRGYTNSTDATAPVLVDANVFSRGDLIALDYNEAIDGTATGAPNREDFSLNVDGSAAEIASVSLLENSPTRVLLIPRLRIYRGQTVSLSYSDPTTGDDARAIQDLAGNDAESFDARVVTNSSFRSLISPLLTASPKGSNSIWLEWDQPRGGDGDGITGYHIEYSDDGGLDWDNVVDYTGDRTSLRSTMHRGLASSTVYSYRISTITGGRSNLPSSIVSAETDVQPPVIDGLSYSTGTGNVSGQNHAVADMCWTPDGVSVSDLDEFQFGLMYAELDENSAMPWEDDGTFTFNDVRLSECDGGAGMGEEKNFLSGLKYFVKFRATQGGAVVESNQVTVQVFNSDTTLKSRILAEGFYGIGRDGEFVFPDVPDPVTGAFEIAVGFGYHFPVEASTTEVTAFALSDLVATNATLSEPAGGLTYEEFIGYRVVVTPTTLGNDVTVRIPGGAATGVGSAKANLASNTFRRTTTSSSP